MLCGFGLGSFIFGLIAIFLVNPGHVEPNQFKEYPPEIARNVPHMLRVLAGIWAVVALSGVLMTFSAPKKTNYFEMDKEQSKGIGVDLNDNPSITGITTPSRRESVNSLNSHNLHVINNQIGVRPGQKILSSIGHKSSDGGSSEETFEIESKKGSMYKEK